MSEGIFLLFGGYILLGVPFGIITTRIIFSADDRLLSVPLLLARLITFSVAGLLWPATAILLIKSFSDDNIGI